MQVLRDELGGSDGLEPLSLRLGKRRLVRLQTHQVHRRRAESGWRAGQRAGGADVPERAASRSVLAQSGPAAAAPQARARTGIQIRKEILVRRATMMVQTQVQPLAPRNDVARSPADGDVVDKAQADIEIGKQIVSAAQVDAVVAPVPLSSGLRADS